MYIAVYKRVKIIQKGDFYMPVVEIRTAASCPVEKIKALPVNVSKTLSGALGWGEERFIVCAEPSLSPSFCMFNGISMTKTENEAMPCLIHISAAPGKSDETIQKIIRAVSSSVSSTLEIPERNVTIIYQSATKLYAHSTFL